MRRSALALVSLILPLSTAIEAAPALPGSKAGGVFVLDNCDPDYQGKESYADNLSYIDGDGKLVFRVTGLNTCEMIGSNRQIAYDAVRKNLWVAECVGNRIRKLDLEGKELTVIKDVHATAIAIEPESGNLWVIRAERGIGSGDMVVFDPKGKELATHSVNGWDLAYDHKGKVFWLAGKDLVKVSLDGKELVRKQVSTWTATSVAVHPETGRVWVASRNHPEVKGSRNEVLGFDRDGELKHTIDFGKRGPFHVAVDKKTGAVWVTDYATAVRRYGVDGNLELERKMEALAAHADPATGEVWIVTRDETLRMTAAGEIVKRVKHAGRTTQAWIAGP